MKTTYFLLFSLLFLNANLKAQSNEIGLSILQFSAYNTTEINPTAEVNNMKHGNFQFTPLFTFNHVKQNRVLYTIQYAFSNNSSNRNDFYSASDTLNYNFKNRSKNSSSTQSIRLGIGKRNYWEKLELTSSIYVPLQFNFHRINTSESELYDIDNNLIETRTNKTRYPNSFSLGVYISQAISYPVVKNFFVGFDINYGFSQNFWNGTRRNEYIAHDNNDNLIIEQTNKNKSKGMSANMNLFPTIFFKYVLPSKK